MSKSNVHPDHYKVAGRDRQDDAAAARQARSVAAKASSQQRPDRMGKKPYFQRPEPAQPAATARPAKSAQKNSRARKVKAKPALPRAPARGRSPATKTRRKAGPRAKRATTRK